LTSARLRSIIFMTGIAKNERGVGVSVMEKKEIRVPNISCGHCVMTIERELDALVGVRSVEGDVDGKRVTIEWESPATWEQIAATLAEINYPPG
jgi:copper chaperone